MPVRYSTKDLRELAKKVITEIAQDNEAEFFRITEKVLSSKLPFQYLYIYGVELGKFGLENPVQYLNLLDKLFYKDIDYGYRAEYFRNRSFWTQDNIRAMILGARISIITTGLGVIGEKYPKKVVPIIKRYLIDGDGWYISDGMSIALGQLLKGHFNYTFSILNNWAKDHNKWLRRAAVVALRELTKNHENEFMDIILRWQEMDYDKNTIWMVKNGIKKLSVDQQSIILQKFSN